MGKKRKLKKYKREIRALKEALNDVEFQRRICIPTYDELLEQNAGLLKQRAEERINFAELLKQFNALKTKSNEDKP